MKINLLTSALVAIVGLAFVGMPVTAQAQTATNATAPAAPSTAPKVKEKKAKGDDTQFPKGAKISALDASSVTLTTAKGDLKLVVGPDTAFQLGHKKATAADFAVGDEVTGSYTTGSDGTLTAYHIRKKAAK